MNPFAARHDPSEASFRSTWSQLGMPTYCPRERSVASIPDSSISKELAPQLDALMIDEEKPRMSLQSSLLTSATKQQSVANEASAFTNTTLGAASRDNSDISPDFSSAAQLDNISRHSLGALHSVVGGTPSVFHILGPFAHNHQVIPDYYLAPLTDSPLGWVADGDDATEAYHWSKFTTAYPSISAGGDPIGRQRTPRRKQQTRGNRQHVQEQGEMTEEGWKCREADRVVAVANLKATAEYLANQDFRPRPQTPDPSCRLLNKRPWEKAVAKWRNEWREIDGIRKLVAMGFDKGASQNAWQKAKSRLDPQQGHSQKDQLEKAVNILTP